MSELNCSFKMGLTR